VVINGAPRAVTLAAERTRQESETAIGERVQRILAKKPAGVIVLLAGGSAALYQEMESDLRRALTLAGPSPQVLPDGERPVPMILIGRPHAGSPLLPTDWPKDDHAQILAWRRFTGRIDLVRQPVMSYNVVGVVAGHDPTLKGEYVAFGAHYDHLGIVPTVHGDSVANGADDDGSGSVALLALARAFVQSPPPKRSVLFVWHVGEEKGLLGSAYFTDHPTVPMDSIVAQVNADMIGRNTPDSLYVVGPSAAPNGQSRALGVVVDSVNAALARPFAFNRTWDSPTDPEQIYYRSDHYNYARHGVPIVFFTSGLHADYHQVTDEWWKIDYAKLARVDLLMFDLGEALADRGSRPR
jgi:Peptidase family M28